MGDRQGDETSRDGRYRKMPKNTPRAAATKWVGGVWTLFWLSMKGGERVGCEETGRANLSTCRKRYRTLAHGALCIARCPLDGMSDDRPTAAQVHTKGDRMDHTAGLGRGTQAGSRMHASLLQDDCDLVPVQHGRGQDRSVTISETSSPLLVPHTGSTRTTGYLRTENILVTFDSRGLPASRAPLLPASAFPDFAHHRP